MISRKGSTPKDSSLSHAGFRQKPERYVPHLLFCHDPAGQPHATRVQEFVVHVKDQRLEDRPTMGWTLTADGVVLGKTSMRPGSGPYAMQRNEYTRDDFLSPSGRRKMKFAELKLTGADFLLCCFKSNDKIGIEDDDLVHTTGNAALGELRVTVYPMNILQRSQIDRAKPVDIGNNVVHERSKKAGAHSIQ
jgi:hypothetical protein